MWRKWVTERGDGGMSGWNGAGRTELGNGLKRGIGEIRMIVGIDVLLIVAG